MAYDYSGLIGKSVKLDRGGPESRHGIVLAVGDDYLVLLHEKEGVLYYSTQHIKSITVNSKDAPMTAAEDTAAAPVNFINPKSFAEVMNSHARRWVQINRGGPESIQGVMTESTPDYTTMVVNHELITMMNYHIRSMGITLKNDENKKEEENKNDANKNENKNDKNKK
jgi:spore coat protein B